MSLKSKRVWLKRFFFNLREVFNSVKPFEDEESDEFEEYDELNEGESDDLSDEAESDEVKPKISRFQQLTNIL